MRRIVDSRALILLICVAMLFNMMSITVLAFGESFETYSMGNGDEQEYEFKEEEDPDNPGNKLYTFVPVSDEDELEILLANEKSELDDAGEISEVENLDEVSMMFTRVRRSGGPSTRQGIDFSAYLTEVRVDVITSTQDNNGFPWDTAFPAYVQLTISSYDGALVVERQTVAVSGPGQVVFPEKMRVYNDNGEKLVFGMSVPKEVDLCPIVEQIHGAGNYSNDTKVLTLSMTFVHLISTKMTTKWEPESSKQEGLKGIFQPGQGVYHFNLPKNGEFTILRNDNGDQPMVDPDILSGTNVNNSRIKLGVEGAVDNKVESGGKKFFIETEYDKFSGGMFNFYEAMTVTLEPDGGTVSPDKIEVPYGRAVGELPTPTPPDGKEFVQWKKDGVAYDTSTPVTENFALVAEYKDKNPDIIPDPEDPDNPIDKPDGYVTVEFKPGANGSLSLPKKFYVNPEADVKLGDITKPKVTPNSGYTHTGWDKADTMVIKEDLVVTAQYSQNVIPTDPEDPETPEGYVLVKFLKGEHGTLTGDTAFNVFKGTAFSEVKAVMPGVVADRGYEHDGWEPSLPEDDEKVEDNQTYTAMYRELDPEEPEDPDMIRVEFLPGDHGKLVGKTVFWVEVGTSFGEVKALMPSVVADKGYTHIGWSPNLPSDNAPILVSATYKAQYRGVGGYIPIGKLEDTKPSTGVGYGTSLQLIKDDHFAYIKGYPDGSFGGERSITRGEVAAIFARLVKGGITGIESGASVFSDVNPAAWYHNSIVFLAKHNIIEGYLDGTFKPDQQITRAEFAAVVARFSVVTGGSSSFSDVLDRHWAKRYIDFAFSKGWITGYPDGTFRPDRDITRSEAVTIVNKVLNRQADKNYVDNNKDKIRDFNDINSGYWAYYNIIEAANSHDYSRNADGSETWIKVTR